MIRRPPRSTLSSSSAASDVYKRQGTNGVSSIRLLQLSNYLKVPINYFFEDFSEYLINLEKSQEGHMNVNYNFLTKLYSELSADQKLKFNKSLQISGTVISKAV